MKKLLVVALSLILFFSFAPQSEAKTKYLKINKTFINTLKDGRLPNTKGKIGMKYGSLKKVTKGFVFTNALFHSYSTNNAEYEFLYNEKNSHTGKVRDHERVDIIYRIYKYPVFEKDIAKYLKKVKIVEDKNNKPVSDVVIYKAGKYYLEFIQGDEELGLYNKASLQVWLGPTCKILD